MGLSNFLKKRKSKKHNGYTSAAYNSLNSDLESYASPPPDQRIKSSARKSLSSNTSRKKEGNRYYQSSSEDDYSYQHDDNESEYEQHRDDTSNLKSPYRQGRGQNKNSKKDKKRSAVGSRKNRRRSEVTAAPDYDDSSDSELLTREELFEYPAKELRKKCRRHGLNPKNAVEKEDLVEILHNFYRQSAQHTDVTTTPTQFGRGGGQYGNSNFKIGAQNNYGRHQEGVAALHETEQMIEILQEIVPYFGQGDPSIDKVVEETIDKLSSYHLDSRDPLGNTIMMSCCRSGAFELIPVLLSKGSDPNAQNNDGETCLHFVCYSDSYSPETAKILIRHGAKAEVREERYGCTPLHWAASIGDTDMCKILCEAGALSSTIDKNMCDPVTYAQQSQKEECANFLLSFANSSINARKRSKSYVESKGDWQRMNDEQTGYIYYHNWKTGESIWEEDFERLKKDERNQEVMEEDNLSTYSDEGKDSSGDMPISTSFAPEAKMIGSPLGRLCSETSIAIKHSEESKVEEKHESASKSIQQNKDSEINNEKDKGLASDKPMHSKLPENDEKSDPANEKSEKEAERNQNLSNNDITSDLRDILSDSNSTVSSVEEVKEDNDAPKHEDNNEKNAKVNSHQSLKVQLPARPLILSPLSPSESDDDKKVVPKMAIDDRLASLQSKMEEQFKEQLDMIETRIGKRESSSLVEQSAEANATITEMTKKVIHLQSDLGTKELEIHSLKRDILTLEEKLKAMNTDPVESKDANIGEGDISEELWVSSESMKQVSDNLELKSSELLHLREEHSDVLAKLGTTERLLHSMKEKQNRIDRQLALAETALQEERTAKTEAIVLLEQTRKGIEVDSTVSKSLEEEKRRNQSMISLLKENLRELEAKSTEEVREMSLQIEAQQKKVLIEASKSQQLEEETKQKLMNYEQEKNSLLQSHGKEIQECRNDIENHIAEKKTIEQKLQDEIEAKMEKENERRKAVDAYEEALKRSESVELKLHQMSTLVKDAKALVGANEKLHRALHMETEKRKTLHNKLEDLKGRIRVYVRIRPMSSKESLSQCAEVLKREDKRTCILDQQDDNEVKSWEFDQIFCGSADGNSQEDVFKDTRLTVTSAVDGFNVCIFAYGQTGSGKTYTMFGPGGEIGEINDIENLDEHMGLAPRVAIELFRLLGEKETSCDTSVKVNMFELYNGNLRDLMAAKKMHNGDLKIRLGEHTKSGLVEVDGSVIETVTNPKELLSLFKRGSQARTTSSTQMNADSSRSHLITSMVITSTHKRSGRVTNGKLTLVDLAGSERVSKSGATGHQLKEAQSINKSLSALGDVINALTSTSKHIPYRNHPLTMLMSDSLGGNAKTLMFVCCSPADYNHNESVNSLDFAKRCKNVTNNIGGDDKGSKQVKALKAELLRLKSLKGGNLKKRTTVTRRPGMQS